MIVSGLSALVRMLGAVRLISWQPMTVGCHPIVGEVLNPPNQRHLIEGVRKTNTKSNRQSPIDRPGSPVALSVGRYCPRRSFALFQTKAKFFSYSRLLIWDRRHAAVSVERLQKTHGPCTKPSAPVEDQSCLWWRSIQRLRDSLLETKFRLLFHSTKIGALEDNSRGNLRSSLTSAGKYL